MSIVLILCLFSQASFAKEPSQVCLKLSSIPVVTFIVPDYENSPFWSTLGNLAIKASEDLNIDLRFHLIPNENRSRFNYADKIEKILIKNKGTDYLVAPFLTGSEKRIMALTEKYGVNFLSYNSPLNTAVKEAIGLPRAIHLHWLGHISPDDEQVGYDAAQLLAEQRQNKPTRLIAINGGRHSAVAKMRFKGLRRKLAEDNQLTLLQGVNTDWSFAQGEDKASQLFQRYQDIHGIWSASDSLAIASLQQWHNLFPDTPPPTIVGIDWTKEIATHIKNNQVLASFGGHVFEGVWLLALIKDHYLGLDFFDENKGIVNYRLRAADKSNVGLLSNIGQINKDLSLLSKCLSGKNSNYEFDAMALMSQ